jgi:hypothetical protein
MNLPSYFKVCESCICLPTCITILKKIEQCHIYSLWPISHINDLMSKCSTLKESAITERNNEEGLWKSHAKIL